MKKKGYVGIDGAWRPLRLRHTEPAVAATSILVYDVGQQRVVHVDLTKLVGTKKL